MRELTAFVEYKLFGVCTPLGRVMGVSSSTIRMYFIYASFITLGSPILLYLSLAFWMNISQYIRKGSSSRDLAYDI
jgi:phage shock protein PspC (stress-responsive transcriptional regulator)